MIAEIRDNRDLAACRRHDRDLHARSVSGHFEDCDAVDQIEIAVDDAQPARALAAQEVNQRLLEKERSLGRHRIDRVGELETLDDDARLGKKVHVCAVVEMQVRQHDEIDLLGSNTHLS